MICLREICLRCRVLNMHHITIGELWDVGTCKATCTKMTIAVIQAYKVEVA